MDGAPPMLVGPLAPTDRIYLAIGLISPNEEELDRFAQEVSDPNSPLYRQYLTEEEFVERFGPSPCNYQSVIDWLQSGGTDVVQTYSDRFLIEVVATVAQIEAIFHVTLSNYLRPDGSIFYGPDRDPSVTIGPEITIDGLDNCFLVTRAGQQR